MLRHRELTWLGAPRPIGIARSLQRPTSAGAARKCSAAGDWSARSAVRAAARADRYRWRPVAAKPARTCGPEPRRLRERRQTSAQTSSWAHCPQKEWRQLPPATFDEVVESRLVEAGKRHDHRPGGEREHA